MKIYSVTDFTASLAEATCADSTWSTIADFFAQFGLDGLVYVDADNKKLTLKSTFPESWSQHYIESNYQKIDPFIEICCENLADPPFLIGADNFHLHSQLSKPQIKMVQEVGEIGYKSGFSNCFRQISDKGFGGWIFMSSEGKRTSEAALKEHGELLHLAAFCAHLTLAKPPALKSNFGLSAREVECIQWLATGLRTQQIAHKMGLKSVTIGFHFRNARKKLGVKTREHALAKALSSGLISL